MEESKGMKYIQYEPYDWDDKNFKGVGWYYFIYEKDFRKGWFGKLDEIEYLFERKCECGVWMERTKGVGEGCFWTDWN